MATGGGNPPRSAFARFFAQESAGGIVLAIAAAIALVVSNTSAVDAYQRFLAIPGTIRIGEHFLELSKPLLVWVNDLWMAVFFFLVGLEIKREFVEGELSSRQQAVLPAAAALGGMVLPALLYAFINRADAVALRGWAIPAATDIAFAIGILMLLGSRVPASLRVFLAAVAIIDDLGAIVVIALFYTDQLSTLALAGAGAGVLVLVALNRMRVMRVDVYAVVGLVIWVFVLKSGVHATLAGVVTALAIPLRDDEGGSPLQSVEHGLHPWVAFLVLPVFAFCNAGVSLAGATPATFVQGIPLGIVAGLVLGKAVGVFGTSWALVGLRWAKLPAGASWLQFLGVSALCGIGFTMSLFIGSLAFEGLDPSYEVRLKLGVLAASLLAAAIGVGVLLFAARRPGGAPPDVTLH